MTADLQKEGRPVGRPTVGPMITLRLSLLLLARVDELARSEGVTRAEMIRLLVHRGMRDTRDRCHEWTGCPKCGATVGERCHRVGSSSRPQASPTRSQWHAVLKHPHRERWEESKP